MVYILGNGTTLWYFIFYFVFYLLGEWETHIKLSVCKHISMEVESGCIISDWTQKNRELQNKRK